MFVKICGITNLVDAEKSVELGASALGFNFYPQSPRFIELQDAARIIAALKKKVLTVGVTVGKANAEQARVVDALQLHGLESESEIQSHGSRVFVATSPDKLDRFPSWDIVIDVSWGTGQVADWDALLRLQRPFILSGGLHPGNVREAILKLHPAGVDVCSGVESAPGKKDETKLERFMAAVREAELESCRLEGQSPRDWEGNPKR
jgi:phosphoribosylanthranilate isomerase